MIVKRAVTQTALTNLQEECNAQKKTKSLVYSKLKTQDYLLKLYPWQSQMISRCRSKTLDIKTHQKFKYNDTLCRWCNLQEGTLDHITNCGEEETEIVDLQNMEKMDNAHKTRVIRMTYRIQEFMDKVDY